MFRAILASVALALSASEIGAQVTTYVVPSRSPEPRMVAAADSAQRDSIARATMTNMKAWVDSAAGVSVPAHVGDTVVAVDSVRPVTTFDDGAVAPATASLLPTLSVLGLIAVAAGSVLLAKRPRG